MRSGHRLKTYFIVTIIVLFCISLVNIWVSMCVEKGYVANTITVPPYFNRLTDGGLVEMVQTTHSSIKEQVDVKATRRTIPTRNYAIDHEHPVNMVATRRSYIKEQVDVKATSNNIPTRNYVIDHEHHSARSVNMLKPTRSFLKEQATVTATRNDISTRNYANNHEHYDLAITRINEVSLNESIDQETYPSELEDILVDSETDATDTTINSVDNVFDITDGDDHVYLVENPEFKQMLEEDNDKINSPRRMWKYKHRSNSSYAERKQVYNMYYRKIVNQGGVNCDMLIEKDNDTISRAYDTMMNIPRKGIRTEKYVYMKDCDSFKRVRGYIEHPLSDSERDFPLAFGIVMYRDVEQTERILRAIYRPHNYYCIHVDRKSDKHIRQAIESIARCLHNVFVASRAENVTWGEFTVLQADLNCMHELWRYESWKYYINLTGQEFPLKTNREIVKILETMDGANIVDGTWVRANEKYFYRWTSAGNRPPHGIRPIKGSVHVLVNRQFVDFSLHDKRALEFLAWLRKTQIPDETYFASLNHNPHLGIKGSFLGETEEYALKPAFMRYKNWELGHSTYSRHCSGKYVRHICILGVGDLQSAYHDIALFVNKFHLDYEYLALDCLEEVLHRKTWQQYLDDTDIDVSYYKHLDYVKYKLA